MKERHTRLARPTASGDLDALPRVVELLRELLGQWRDFFWAQRHDWWWCEGELGVGTRAGVSEKKSDVEQPVVGQGGQ